MFGNYGEQHSRRGFGLGSALIPTGLSSISSPAQLRLAPPKIDSGATPIVAEIKEADEAAIKKAKDPVEEIDLGDAVDKLRAGAGI